MCIIDFNAVYQVHECRTNVHYKQKGVRRNLDHCVAASTDISPGYRNMGRFMDSEKLPALVNVTVN